MMINHKKLIQVFNSEFGLDGEKPRIFFAPGRVNLIGEHTDYNGGKVLPAAIDAGTYMVIRKNNTALIKLYSENFDYKCTIRSGEPIKKIGNEWVNYPLGVIQEFISNGNYIGGFEVMYSGNIPNSAGLSSSASIEMATAFGLNQLFETAHGLMDLVRLCKRAENNFVGVNCGIMDMFAVGFGKENHAIALDCKTMEFEYAPVNLNELRLVVANTNKSRGLSDSKYNERVAECQAAMKLIQGEKIIGDLSELSLAEFEHFESLINDETIKKRAYHVISENKRVDESLEALNAGDMTRFGQLMYASHKSLRDQYEVTGVELDALVEAAAKIEGVIGSRMTGAGFGGCTISLVENSKLDQFYDHVSSEYQSKTGLRPSFYLFKLSDGVRELCVDQ